MHQVANGIDWSDLNGRVDVLVKFFLPIGIDAFMGTKLQIFFKKRGEMGDFLLNVGKDCVVKLFLM